MSLGSFYLCLVKDSGLWLNLISWTCFRICFCLDPLCFNLCIRLRVIFLKLFASEFVRRYLCVSPLLMAASIEGG